MGDYMMLTCHHTMPEPTPVLTMTLTSIKAVKPLHATTRPKNLAMLPPYSHAGKSHLSDFSYRALVVVAK